MCKRKYLHQMGNEQDIDGQTMRHLYRLKSYLNDNGLECVINEMYWRAEFTFSCRTLPDMKGFVEFTGEMDGERQYAVFYTQPLMNEARFWWGTALENFNAANRKISGGTFLINPEDDEIYLRTRITFTEEDMPERILLAVARMVTVIETELVPILKEEYSVIYSQIAHKPSWKSHRGYYNDRD